MKPTPYVVELKPELRDKLLKDLEGQGFEIFHPPNTVFQGRKHGVSCTLYASGKLVVQGKESPAFIEFYLEPELLGTFKLKYEHLDVDLTNRMGVDEAGKGDFFGPLCIAGVCAGGKEIEELIQMGIKDSKRMQDSSIAKMAKLIRAKVPYHIVRIGPKKYNELYQQFGNLNLLLAWGHATVIEALQQKTSCKKVVVDQFSEAPLVENVLKRKKIEIDFTKRTKAESDPVVAAASILARDAFVSGLKVLSEWLELELPKGASKQVIDAGKKLLREKGVSIFPEIAKMHFKTLDAITGKSREFEL